MNNNNPFLQSKGIADNENKLNNNVKNPFIEAKKKSDEKKLNKKRKSILFYIDDYEKIVALSKTKGDTISGYINSLVEKEISHLDSIDTERYKEFLNNK